MSTDMMSTSQQSELQNQSTPILTESIEIQPVVAEEAVVEEIGLDEICDDMIEDEADFIDENDIDDVGVYEEIFGEDTSREDIFQEEEQEIQFVDLGERPEVKGSAFDDVLQSLKKRKRVKVSSANKSLKMQLLVSRMHEAAKVDCRLVLANRPASSKMQMLQEVQTLVQKQEWRSDFVSAGGVSALTAWLNVLPNGASPNDGLVEQVLKMLAVLPLTHEHIRLSGIGKVVASIFKNAQKPNRLRRLAQNLVNRWVRGIFGQTQSHKRGRTLTYAESSDAPVAKRSKKSTQEEFDESLSRRHPVMFEKPKFNFTVLPRSNDLRTASKGNKVMTTRLSRTVQNLRYSGLAKCQEVSIAGRTMNLAFKEEETTKTDVFAKDRKVWATVEVGQYFERR